MRSQLRIRFLAGAEMEHRRHSTAPQHQAACDRADKTTGVPREMLGNAQERSTNGQRRSALVRFERNEGLVHIGLLSTQKRRQPPEWHEQEQAGTCKRNGRLEMNSLLAERKCKKPG